MKMKKEEYSKVKLLMGKNMVGERCFSLMAHTMRVNSKTMRSMEEEFYTIVRKNLHMMVCGWTENFMAKGFFIIKILLNLHSHLILKISTKFRIIGSNTKVQFHLYRRFF